MGVGGRGGFTQFVNGYSRMTTDPFGGGRGVLSLCMTVVI